VASCLHLLGAGDFHMASTFHSATYHEPKTLTQKVCTSLGIFFLLIGAFGFLIPHLMGTHLSPLHNLIHLVSAILALAAGSSERPNLAFRFALTFGTIYGLLGAMGLILGTPGTAMILPYDHDPFLLRIIPGMFELTSNDHGFHLIVAAILLFSIIPPKNEAHDH
jgi:hypothetical protein